MTERGAGPGEGYREQIRASLTPVRPLAAPAWRVGRLVPFGVLLALTAPVLHGERGDLGAYAPAITWGLSSAQALLGLWILSLGFREAVPGRNVAGPALALAGTLAAAIVLGATFVTNAASPTVVPPARAWQDWAECVVWPMALAVPLLIAAALMVARAFPTRPALAGALCGLSAGLLADAGWRLSCWISHPTHIVSSHGLALVGLTAAGALLGVWLDRPRWRRTTLEG